MKICLVNYEEGITKDGILTKFAVEMNKVLLELGHESYIRSTPDPEADINHHINYLPYQHVDTINTLMITHLLDNKEKMKALKKHMTTADMGICMSKDMMLSLPFAQEKLSYVLPAHSNEPRRPIVIGILTKVYPDGCKREWMLEELCKVIDKSRFAFRVMGQGWMPVLEKLQAEGVQIDYVPDFNKEIHKLILDSSDYYLYFGLDEGSMATVEAINAGLKVITTPVGFHKEMLLDHSFTTQEELNNIFLKKLDRNPVKKLTWENYTKAHLKIWKKLHETKSR